MPSLQWLVEGGRVRTLFPPSSAGGRCHGTEEVGEGSCQIVRWSDCQTAVSKRKGVGKGYLYLLLVIRSLV